MGGVLNWQPNEAPLDVHLTPLLPREVDTPIRELEDSSRLDFDDFMKLMFHMHTAQLPKHRKQAGFTDDQVTVPWPQGRQKKK